MKTLKSFLIVNHPVPSVGFGGKVIEDSLLAIKKVTNTSSSTTVTLKVTKPTPLPFEKRRFGNHTRARGFLS